MPLNQTGIVCLSNNYLCLHLFLDMSHFTEMAAPAHKAT